MRNEMFLRNLYIPIELAPSHEQLGGLWKNESYIDQEVSNKRKSIAPYGAYIQGRN
jgi:hypothetical protein